LRPSRISSVFFEVFASAPLTGHGRNKSAGNLRSLFSTARPPEESKSEGQGKLAKLGVHTLTVRPSNTAMSESKRQNLSEIKDRCLHNASICAQIGNTEKEGVWKLLAHTVERQIEEIDGRYAFSGWGGSGGGALGVDLVGNLLKYYEALGDCQMLATMACVLSGGRRSGLRREVRIAGEEYRPYLLPLDQDEKYDSYIRKYADLLYEWGLLTLRVELNKHLVRVPIERDYAVSMSSARIEKQTTASVSTGVGVEERQPGVAIVYHCFQCGRDTDSNSNYCRSCQAFAFRCSICDIAVKGLFTVCNKCHHGGHLGHMTIWFSEHDQCPTGCGCTCVLSTRITGGAVEVPLTARFVNEIDPVI